MGHDGRREPGAREQHAQHEQTAVAESVRFSFRGERLRGMKRRVLFRAGTVDRGHGSGLKEEDDADWGRAGIQGEKTWTRSPKACAQPVALEPVAVFL